MDIKTILPNDYVTKEAIWLPEAEASTTVWDTLATDDLLDAATSATSEAHAKAKGRPQVEQLKQAAGHGVLLDLGCGYGRVAEQLLPEHTMEAYVGVDSSLSMLRYAYERKQDLSLDTPLHFVYGAIDKIPLADHSVDAVVVSAVFLHNHKSVTTNSVAEIHRVLKPGGKLFVFSSFPNFHSLMGYQVSFYLKTLEWFGDPYRNGPVRYFSRREVRRLLSAYDEVFIAPFGFGVLPKRILILPGFINRIYRTLIANPINRLFEWLLPTVIARNFSTHHDVVATK